MLDNEKEARAVYQEGFDSLKSAENKEERVMLVDSWREFEQKVGKTEFIEAVKAKQPKRVCFCCLLSLVVLVELEVAVVVVVVVVAVVAVVVLACCLSLLLILSHTPHSTRLALTLHTHTLTHSHTHTTTGYQETCH